MNKNQKIAIGITIAVIVLGISLIYNKFYKKKDLSILKKSINETYDNLLFQLNKAIILPTSYPFLNELASALNDNLEYNLEIIGHTDNVGSEQSNLILSQNRANAVKNYLINEKVSANRITSIGKGENMPITSNKTLEGREKNRRVEFILKKIVVENTQNNEMQEQTIIENEDESIII